ncbi:hypothetical protein SORBI_3010G119100 [Sorghum bicolor]|uniref:Uncharacterized protein n=1 Tax=Sorghum bicolor TaxID=4558 RepID=A0A1W0VSJ7_SORBI|nr:hypothetical protein SORBI_3010G119100 [Sorghum bicolor]OQU76248.1 hypothetical protein SORBI_3010G119100 [Sorghum bicolor]
MHIMWACGSSSFNSHPTSNCIFYTKHLHLFMTITHYGLSGFAFHSMLLWTTRETNITLLILMSSMSHFKPLIWMGANSSKMITDKSHGSHEKMGAENSKTFTSKSHGADDKMGADNSKTFTSKIHGADEKMGADNSKTFTSKSHGADEKMGADNSKAFTGKCHEAHEKVAADPRVFW